MDLKFKAKQVPLGNKQRLPAIMTKEELIKLSKHVKRPDIAMAMWISIFHGLRLGEMTESENKNFHKETERARITKEVLEYERKERALAILNMMEILRLRKLGEGEIRKDLRGNGFTDEDINNALRMQTEEEARLAKKKITPVEKK